MADVVVGVDGSPSALDALKWAHEEARLRGATLRVVCAYQLPTSWLGMGEALGSAVSATLSNDDLERYAVATIDEALGALGELDGVEVTKEPRSGHPAQVLLDATTTDSILVIGSRGHGEVGSVLLGSVGMHCVHHASCPVVVIPRASEG